MHFHQKIRNFSLIYIVYWKILLRRKIRFEIVKIEYESKKIQIEIFEKIRIEMAFRPESESILHFDSRSCLFLYHFITHSS